MGELTVERAARNEVVFRDANEILENRREELTEVVGRTPFLCECSDPYCKAVVMLTLDEYEHIRAAGNRLFLLPGRRQPILPATGPPDDRVGRGGRERPLRRRREAGAVAPDRRGEQPEGMSGERARRVEENEHLFGAVNQAIAQVNRKLGLDDTVEQYLCECSVLTCAERIALTRDEYEEVRKRPNQFFMVAGHRDPVHERIIRETDRYIMVEKTT